MWGAIIIIDGFQLLICVGVVKNTCLLIVILRGYVKVRDLQFFECVGLLWVL